MYTSFQQGEYYFDKRKNCMYGGVWIGFWQLSLLLV